MVIKLEGQISIHLSSTLVHAHMHALIPTFGNMHHKTNKRHIIRQSCRRSVRQTHSYTVTQLVSH